MRILVPCYDEFIAKDAYDSFDKNMDFLLISSDDCIRINMSDLKMNKKPYTDCFEEIIGILYAEEFSISEQINNIRIDDFGIKSYGMAHNFGDVKYIGKSTILHTKERGNSTLFWHEGYEVVTDSITSYVCLLNGKPVAVQITGDLIYGIKVSRCDALKLLI